MRCDHCKYWNKNEMRLNKTVAMCTKTILMYNATEWINNDDIENDDFYQRKLKDEYKDLKMFVQDGSDYVAYLYTAANFYCAHYEVI